MDKTTQFLLPGWDARLTFLGTGLMQLACGSDPAWDAHLAAGMVRPL
ncbi:hypothetical protein [Caulobacter sp. BE254]|jgi:hypothetical protein|nr:hypothetical protein [Caulobacter sp. BE254]MDR7118807.1 hypothetical protein [Caulobacter sp. BE254]